MDFNAWLYDIYELAMASKRKFREAKSAEEEKKMFDKAITRSTRSVPTFSYNQDFPRVEGNEGE